MGTFLSTIASTRPDRLHDKKDEAYHLQFGKWAFMMGYNNPSRTAYVERIRRNEDFYRNLQWKSQEDITTFLKDQSGQDRNRITFTMNMIRQLVEQYRGNATQMRSRYRAKNISPFAITRREEKLAEMLFFFSQSQKNPIYAEGLKKRLLIGDSREETVSLFNNVYVDDLTKAINALLREVAEMNQFNDYIQIFVAEQLAFSGLGVVHDFEYAGYHKFEPIRTEDFFWDMDNSRRPDLQDSEYMGLVNWFSAPQILEMAKQPLDQKAKESIENYDKRVGTAYFGNTEQRSGQPVCTSYWRDTTPIWYGYVMDEFGNPFFTEINYVQEGQDKPKYTDADLIDAPDTIEARRRMKGNKKVRIDIDNIRFCQFVPWQASSNSFSIGKEKDNVDIVLDHGMLPYQDNQFLNYTNVNFPFKCSAWSILKGEVSSPIDDAINPQRFFNRMMSAMENQVNNAGGSGVAIDSSMVDVEDDSEITSNVNQSKPIFLDAKGKGIGNAVGKYEGGVSAATYNMFGFIPMLKQLVDGSTGFNQAMRGEQVGQDQLVGVTSAMLQQGSLLQAPFYHSLSMIMKQCYQTIADRGKKIYIDNKRQLINAVGDYNAEVITLSKDAKLEDFRIFLELDENPRQLIQAANQMLLLFKSQNLIDDVAFGNLIGRAMPEDVYEAVRAYAGQKVIMSRVQAKQQQQDREVMIKLAERQEQREDQKELNQMAHENMMQDKDIAADKEKIGLKGATRQLYQQPPPPIIAPNRVSP